MSVQTVETVDMQKTFDEVPQAVSPPITLQRLTEVPPPPAFAPPPAPEARKPPAGPVPPPPGLSSPLGHSLPIEVKEVDLEAKELIDSVSAELTKIADGFASSEFMTKDEHFEFEYFTTMLPPGLHDPTGAIMKYPDDIEEESDNQSIRNPSKDGNESSDESTMADSNPDESSKAESNPDMDGSPAVSVENSDEGEDESDDEVASLPDLSPEGVRSRKLEKLQAKRTAKMAADNKKAGTRIVFGDQGAELAAQAALMASNSGYGGVMTWQPPPYAQAYGWHPYYGYVAW